MIIIFHYYSFVSITHDMNTNINFKTSSIIIIAA